MTPEERAALINAKVADALIKAAGMTAENMQRQVTGASMAYWGDSFEGLAAELEASVAALKEKP